MKVVVFGATGNTGAEVVTACVSAGYQVVAAVRRPEAVTARAGVSVAQIDLSDSSSVEAAMEGCDVVVSGLGLGGLGAARECATFYSDGVRTLRTAMRATGVKRIIVMSSSGVQEEAGAPWYYNLLLRRYVMNTYIDMARMETILEESGDLQFTCVRLPYLVREGQGKLIVGDRTVGSAQFKLSYKDAALFIVDEIAAGKWIGCHPVPSYA